MKAIINSEYIRRLAPFVSKEEVRFPIHGIQLTKHPIKGVIAIATDGNALAMFYDPNGEIDCEEILVKLSKKLLSAIRSLKTKEGLIIIKERSIFLDQRSSSKTIYEEEFTPHGYKFPDVKRIIKSALEEADQSKTKYEHMDFSAFNASYLDLFQKACVFKNNFSGIKILGTNSYDPYRAPRIILPLSNEHFFMGILMPMATRFNKSDMNWTQDIFAK